MSIIQALLVFAAVTSGMSVFAASAAGRILGQTNDEECRDFELWWSAATCALVTTWGVLAFIGLDWLWSAH